MSFPLYGKNFATTLLNWAPKLTELKKAFLELLTPLEWGQWLPTVSCNGSMTFTTVELECWYFRLFKTVFFTAYTRGTTGGVANNEIIIPLPVAPKSSTVTVPGCAHVVDGGISIGGVAYLSDRLHVTRYDGANFGLGADRYVRSLGFYRIA